MIDAEHGTIYGTIVATSYNAQESYLVPAKDILESLRERWPASNIQFPAVNVEVATKNARIHYKFGKFLVNSMGRYIRRESTPSSPSDFQERGQRADKLSAPCTWYTQGHTFGQYQYRC